MEPVPATDSTKRTGVLSLDTVLSTAHHVLVGLSLLPRLRAQITSTSFDSVFYRTASTTLSTEPHFVHTNRLLPVASRTASLNSRRTSITEIRL